MGYKDLPEAKKEEYLAEGIVMPYLIELDKLNNTGLIPLDIT